MEKLTSADLALLGGKTVSSASEIADEKDGSIVVLRFRDGMDLIVRCEQGKIVLYGTWAC